jgi:hypothetical protein
MVLRDFFFETDGSERLGSHGKREIFPGQTIGAYGKARPKPGYTRNFITFETVAELDLDNKKHKVSR